MSAKIVVVGSSNTDMIIQLKRLPKPGETIVGGVFTTAAEAREPTRLLAPLEQAAM